MKASDGGYKEAKIFSLVLIPLLGQYVLTLEEMGGQRLVPIWIGVNEGNAIGLKLQDEQLPRPMTHDLMNNILKTLGAKVDRVLISDLRDGTYYAVISLSAGTPTASRSTPGRPTRWRWRSAARPRSSWGRRC